LWRRLEVSAAREVREPRLAHTAFGAARRREDRFDRRRRPRRHARRRLMSNALVNRKDFPLLANHPDLHYLDSAATSQKPRAVLDVMIAYYENDNANPHRGAYELSARATERYHQARERIARFVGVADSACLIFVRGTTEALNLVSWTWAKSNVREGD